MQSIRLRYHIFIILNVLSFATSLLCAELPWRKITYPDFSVISRADDQRMRDCAKQFQVFTSMMKTALPVDTKYLPPLTIVLFNRPRDLAQYKPETPDGGKARWVGAFFRNFDTWSIIGMSTQIDKEEIHRVIFHEGVHWYMSALHRDYPKWFKEGMAEVFSNFEYQHGKITWGLSNENYINWLIYEHPQPIDKFIKIKNEDDVFNNGYTTGQFYAQSWAFVHYLLFDDADTSFSKLRKIRDSLSTVQIHNVFNSQSEESLSQINREFIGYMMRGAIPHSASKNITISDDNAPIEAISDEEVTVALGRLALTTAKKTQVQQFSQSLQKGNGSQAEGLDLLTLMYQMESNDDSAAIFADSAIDAGSKNAQTYFIAANRRWKSVKELTPQKARKIANLYKKAIAYYPGYRDAYRNFAGIINATQYLCNQDDCAIAKQGLEFFPDVPQIVLGAAITLSLTGENRNVYSLIDKAVAIASHSDSQFVSFAEKIRANCLKSDYRQAIDSLVSNDKYDTAIELITAMINKKEYSFMLNELTVRQNQLMSIQKTNQSSQPKRKTLK